MTNSNTIAKSLNPILSLEGKNNFQKFFLIEKDGNIKERIILFINNIKLREDVICFHFLSRYIQVFIEKRTGIKFVSRDDPWDFQIELSNSEKLTIEITSIADEVDLFKTFKYQERISERSNFKKLEFHELVKLNNLFPQRDIQKEIDKLRINKVKNNQLVSNPYYGKSFFFESSISDNLECFEKILKKSIDKKTEKTHSNKQNLILIIDNRTVTYELEDIISYLGNMNDYFNNLPFKEVWLYTGYYSDFDGNNAEYSFVPLKLDELKLDKLKIKLKL
jgi:hypothetical protein